LESLRKNNGGQDVGEKNLHTLLECKLVQTLWKLVWRFFTKIKMKLPHDPTIPFLGLYMKEYK
jgi:hypothetical protein